MTDSVLEERKNRAYLWFSELQRFFIERFESLENSKEGLDQNSAPGKFQITSWDHPQNGGGRMAAMAGRVFEKVGVNVSCVWGEFSPEFRSEIPGTEEDPRFWACGLSLVAHPKNPHVPIAHMNTRMIITSKLWFGGGGDLTPIFPQAQDTADFHQVFKQVCDQYQPDAYQKFKEWCDTYFYLPHRQEARGVGGTFYDYLNSGDWEADFEFSRQTGLAFLNIYPEIIIRHFGKPYTEEERYAQLVKRGKYAEFNLLYDRGTRFGLKTGGNPHAILMSLPPLAAWPLP